MRSKVSLKGLFPELAHKIQFVAVQSMAVFGADLLWRDHKAWEQQFQKIFNRQGRTITRMFRTAPMRVIVKEVGLLPVVSSMNNRQRRYTQRLLTLPKDNVLREILPEILREGDAYAQPGEQESNWGWLSPRPKNPGQRLA